MSHEAVISASGVVKRFGRTVALAGLDADVGPGITGLLGSNGAGKTTFISLVLGLRSRDDGQLAQPEAQPATGFGAKERNKRRTTYAAARATRARAMRSCAGMGMESASVARVRRRTAQPRNRVPIW